MITALQTRALIYRQVHYYKFLSLTWQFNSMDTFTQSTLEALRKLNHPELDYQG